ncbi:hypothetical protein M5K25_020350 [Dendrobium thyrsiflorum]|uniref:Uncharacterized protein n=1 Tax=Dendrobium thyrsiflorum TaxID=117978 RepID=A0ABD0UGH2_DENTH
MTVALLSPTPHGPRCCRLPRKPLASLARPANPRQAVTSIPLECPALGPSNVVSFAMLHRILHSFRGFIREVHFGFLTPNSTRCSIISSGSLLRSVKCPQPDPLSFARISDLSCPLAPWALTDSSELVIFVVLIDHFAHLSLVLKLLEISLEIIFELRRSNLSASLLLLPQIRPEIVGGDPLRSCCCDEIGDNRASAHLEMNKENNSLFFGF